MRRFRASEPQDSCRLAQSSVKMTFDVILIFGNLVALSRFLDLGADIESRRGSRTFVMFSLF